MIKLDDDACCAPQRANENGVGEPVMPLPPASSGVRSRWLHATGARCCGPRQCMPACSAFYVLCADLQRDCGGTHTHTNTHNLHRSVGCVLSRCISLLPAVMHATPACAPACLHAHRHCHTCCNAGKSTSNAKRSSKRLSNSGARRRCVSGVGWLAG